MRFAFESSFPNLHPRPTVPNCSNEVQSELPGLFGLFIRRQFLFMFSDKSLLLRLLCVHPLLWSFPSCSLLARVPSASTTLPVPKPPASIPASSSSFDVSCLFQLYLQFGLLGSCGLSLDFKFFLLTCFLL